MSLVGPSPRLAGCTPTPGALWPEVRPGVFSLSALRQRTGIAFDDRGQIEDDYLRQRSLKKDLGLVARSLLLSWLPESPPDCPERLHLFDLELGNPTMEQALATMGEWTRQPQARRVAFVNAHCVNVMQHNPSYRQALQSCDWLLCDGFGMRLAGLALGQPLRDNVNGTDLFPALCASLSPTRVFLFGAKPGVAEAVAEWIQGHHPQLQVVGCQHGYLQSDQEHQALLERMRGLQPQLTLVALGVPAQELWLQRWREQLPPGLYLAVGGLFDFFSGRIPRAPQWLRELGLEWTYRLLQEPRRMARRYLVGNLIFAGHVRRERRKAQP